MSDMAKDKKKNKGEDPYTTLTNEPDPQAQVMEVANPAERAAAGAPSGPVHVDQAPVSGVGTDISGQVTQAWEGLLGMATSQGATRRDIVIMTLLTAGSVLDITAVNLWPIGSDLPPDELQGFGAYQAALGGVQAALTALGQPTVFESIPWTGPQTESDR